MGLLGNGWDDPQSSAIMSLAGGLLQGNFGAGLLGANDAYANAKKSAMEQKFRDMQMKNYESEIEARKLKTIQDQRQQRLMESFFPGLLGEGAPAGASTMGAGPSGGVAPGAPAQGGNDILRIAQQYGIPPQAIQADIVFNGGKKISELLDKHGSRDMQVTNGYAYDRNQLGAGFMPFLNTSQSGQTSMGRIGPDGLPVVSAPAGAMETYGAYRGMDEGTRAKFDPLPITPAGSTSPVMRSRLSVMQEANATPQPGMQGAFTGSPEAVASAIAGIRDPQERANALAAFEQQMRASGGRLPAPGGIALADPSEEAARKEQMVQGAKDVAEQRKAIMNAGFSAPSNIARYQQIGKLLADVDGGALTPTGTHLASLANSLGVKIDKNLPNKEAAASLANAAALELRNPAGGAGMPGALSDADRNFLSSMTPNMTQSAQGRKLVIDAYVSIQARNQQVSQFARNYEKKHGRLDNGFFEQLQAWSAANPIFKGQ